eukprot:TRINITY_DN5676_c0_g1_i2.p2 TRINITY_DN5676_c0_g1~~TRINITY_DN5676_c0_g1_i2.p2  ORF type:complete len:233 (-),score=30.34 TRINITY_DN5676_c0_g1_i2:43-741(-)
MVVPQKKETTSPHNRHGEHGCRGGGTRWLCGWTCERCKISLPLKCNGPPLVFGCHSCTVATGVAVDAAGNLIVADTRNHCLRKIFTDGHVSTIAGARPHVFDRPICATLFGDGVLVAEEFGNRISLWTPQEDDVSTFVGATLARYKVPLRSPMGVAADTAGNIVVADTKSHCVRIISPRGHVTTIGNMERPGLADGSAGEALFDDPVAVAIDTAGDVIVADPQNFCLRKITL